MSALLGESPAVQLLRSQIARTAPTPLPILVTGETGTGKEVVARLVHDQSGRAGPFVPIDCGALAPTLVETELFGHERGAFTGANTRRDGLVHAARGGTFFLDEVGELPLEAQTRLLRLLEAGTYRPVGALEERRADIRVVAATWRDLTGAVERGTFRRDLYHRLAIVDLRLPPLRDRGGDAQLLLDAFLRDASRAARRAPPILEPATRQLLDRWRWPGNLRELKNLAQVLAALAPPRVRPDDLPALYRGGGPAAPVGAASAPPGEAMAIRADLPYLDARRLWLDAFQDRYVAAVLERHGGNISAAARASGMDRRSIQRARSRQFSSATDVGDETG